MFLQNQDRDAPSDRTESRAVLTDGMIEFIESLGNLVPYEYDHLFNLATEEKRWKYLRYLSEFHWQRSLQWEGWLEKQNRPE